MNLDFKNITLDTKTLINSYTKPWNTECSDFSFANMFIWGTDGKLQYAQKDDVLYIKLNFPGVPEYFWAPIPKKGSSFDYCSLIKNCTDYLEERELPATIRSISGPFVEMAAQANPKLFKTETPFASDYVYLSENMISLKGKKLHGKRNHINKFILTNDEFKFVPLESSMYSDCMKIYEEWSENKDDDESLSDEQKSVKLALKNLTALDLNGGCIVLNGNIEAFTVGERLTSDMQLIHIEKANPSINGLYPMINQQYAMKNCSDVTYINREEDMGIEGMRHAKRSYQPVKMIDKFIFSKQDPKTLQGLWGEDKDHLLAQASTL